MGGYRHSLVGLLAIALAFAAIVGIVPRAMGQETISTNLVRTESVAPDTWDAFTVVVPSGRVANIVITGASGIVDFYIFTASQYTDYINPSVATFGFVRSQENARSFSHSLGESGRILVVDNADVSASGASPTGDVSYLLSVTFASAPPYALVGGIVLLVLIVVVVVIAVAIRRRKARQVPPMMPPMQPPMQPPPPPGP